MSSRIIAILGATGNQGASVLEAVLADGTFTPRAITRNLESDSAKKLAARGVQVVKGDSADKASLVSAFTGAEGVFVVTIRPGPHDTAGTPEDIQGKNAVDAAKEAQVKFLVFSALPSINKISNGKYQNAKNYEDKAAVQEYLAASGVPSATIHTAAFLEAVSSDKSPFFRAGADGSYTLMLPKFAPTALQCFTWVAKDVGATVLGIFKNYTNPGVKVHGRIFPVVTARMTMPEIAELVSKAIGKKVTFVSLPTSGIPMIDDMFAAQSEYNGFYQIDIPNPDLVELGVKLSTVEQFMDTLKTKSF